MPDRSASFTIARSHRRRFLRRAICSLAALTASCGDLSGASQQPDPSQGLTSTAPPVPTLVPTRAQSPGDAAPLETPDTGWLPGAQGVELRRLQVPLQPERPPAEVVVVRLDPTAIKVRVAYAPDRPLMLRGWVAQQRPLAAINGGFFAEGYHSTALVISDGTAHESSYEGFGGMLAVSPEGTISLRALADEPYNPNEALAQAVQSFPMLVQPGGRPAQIDDSGERARRSAVAQDHAGHLLLIACPTSRFTLTDLATWLANSDLEIDRALNLDGGSSTGLYLSDGTHDLLIDSFGPLPTVILIEPA